MKASIHKKCKNPMLLVVLTSFLFFYINIEKALSGGGDATPTPTITEVTPENSSLTPSTTENSSTITVTPTTLLQTGTNNYANVNSNIGALNYPNCYGTCAFAIMRTTPVNNSNGTISNQIEGVLGLIHSFSSPDQINAGTNRQLIDIQKQRSESEITINYIKTIADACQAKDIIRAELTAKALAMIWKVDYKTLLHHSCS